MTSRPHRSLIPFNLFVPLLGLWFPFPSFARDTATIMRVVDGDTVGITLKGHTEKVRLIGIDTPEVYESDKLHRDAARTGQDEKTIQALGKRASDFTKSLVHAGDTVQLEYDQQPRDKYHRLLAFVWLSVGRMLNETIVCEGYGNALTRYLFDRIIWIALEPARGKHGNKGRDCGEKG